MCTRGEFPFRSVICVGLEANQPLVQSKYRNIRSRLIFAFYFVKQLTLHAQSRSAAVALVSIAGNLIQVFAPALGIAWSHR